LSTTVTCELRVQPGHVDEIIQRATEQLSLPSHSVVGRRHARLYQQLDDPNCLLYVGEWESRSAFETYRATAPIPGRSEQFQHLPTFRYYRRIALFEHVLSVVDVAYVDVVHGPPDTHVARRDLALSFHRTEARRQTGLVLLMTSEHVEEPHDLLLVSGWRSPSPGSQPAPSPDQALIDQLRADGGAVNRFIGRQLIETATVSPQS
jgi:quinol monooxygenase YgiN